MDAALSSQFGEHTKDLATARAIKKALTESTAYGREGFRNRPIGSRKITMDYRYHQLPGG